MYDTAGKIRFLIVIIAILFLGIFVVYYFLNSVKSEFSQLNILETETVVPSTTPFLFEEMTIPYLRSRVYESNLGSLDKVSENNSYTSYLTSYDSDGLKINSFLTVPKGEKPEGGFGAIVFVHGYIPPKEYQTIQNYSAYVDYLAREGFVVFKIDLRGHADSEGSPGGAYYSSDYVVDTLNAVAALKSSDLVNPKRIGLWGHSMAGNVVFRSMVAFADIPAVVIWAGAVYSYEDFVKYGLSDNSYMPPPGDSERQKRRELLFNTYGRYGNDSEFWQKVAATNYLDDIKGAIQIHHAIGDPVVNIGYSRDLAKVLEEADVSYSLYEYGSGGHNITGSSFDLAMKRTVDFFGDKLQN